MNPRPLLCATLLVLATPLPAQDPATAIDPRHLDTTIAACDDFYQHANGGWLHSHPVPPGVGSHGLFDELRQRHQQRRLQRVALIAADPSRQGEPLADFLASGMDEAAIEAHGRSDLDRLLAELDGLRDPPKQLPALLAKLHAQGLPLLFRSDVAQLPSGPQLRLLAGGLGLPDRDFYLREDADTRALLGHYRRYVERLLALTGSADPAAGAAWVLDAETRLARGWPPHGETPASVSALSLRELQRRYPSIDWREWLRAQGLPRQRDIALPHPAFFADLDALIANAHPVQWEAYLRFHLAHLLAPFLGAEFVAAHDALYQRVLRGRQTALVRSERALEAGERVLGPAFERDLVGWLLPASRRQPLEAMIAAVRNELDRGLETAPWLDDASRPAARQRLAQLSLEIAMTADGMPLDGLGFDRRRFSHNVLLAARALHRDRLAALTAGRGAAVRRAQGTPAMAAQYDPRSNKLQLGIGLLQPPLFDPDGDPALQYGALGALVGHELLHGFDLAGAAWAGETPSPERVQAFEQHTAPLVTQFNAYLALGGRPVDGARTLAENAADLAGVELAHAALQRLDPAPAAELAGHAVDQRFYLGWARMWRRNYRDDDLLQRLAHDPQAPSAFRVNGPLSHQPAFAAAFGCQPGQPMLREATQRLQMFR
jgi:putative endopeptidase